MKPLISHKWKVSVNEARKIQVELQNKINLGDVYKSISEINTVAACDISFGGDKDGGKIVVAVVVMTFPELKVIDKVVMRKDPKSYSLFPYVPTYLSFREGPLIMECLGRLKNLIPDVIIFDGQGIAHPRKMGIATHLGILYDIVTVGCAKNVLYGTYEEPPSDIKGASTFLKDDYGEIIGVCLRTKKNVKPVFVSPGHKISVGLSSDLVLACCRKCRLPEPIRIAHQLAKNC